MDSCNFTNEANSHAFEVEIYTLHAILAAMIRKEAILSKKFRPGHKGWSVHMGKFSSRLPRSRKNRDLGRASPASHMNTSKF